MSNTWQHKLDAFGRMQLDEGFPLEGIDVTVRLISREASAVKEILGTGLIMHSHVGEIVVGHIDNEFDLKQLAELASVAEVSLARPLYGDQVD